MNEFADAARQAVQLAVPATIALVIVTVLISVAAGWRRDTDDTNGPRAVDRLYEHQITILEDPTESGYGLAYREIDIGAELLRIEKVDGQYYKSSRFTVYEEELADTADELSMRPVEMEHNG